ncbi:hypothetical protein Bca4012_059861 [Brassica carinata]
MVLRRKEVKKSYAVVSSTIFCIFLLFISPADTYVFNFEVLALIEIKSSLTDPHGVLMNWNIDAADPCSWNLITCSPDNFVLSIEAANHSFSGTLASRSIGNLTSLETVLLQNNYITGNIPPEIGKLMKLKTLDLSNNNFTGQIPSTLSHSKSLQYLKLNNNSLTGTIPTSVANMTQLILLDLSYNNLSGPVPKLLANTFNIMGNPQLCSTGTEEDCKGTHPKPTSLTFTSSQTSDGGTIKQKIAVQFCLSLICICLFVIGFDFY